MTPSRHRRRFVAIAAVVALGGLGAGVVPHLANATVRHPQSLGAPAAVAPSGALTVDPSLANCGTTGCDLYAALGSVTAGSDPAVPIWGFTSNSSGPGLFGGNPLNTIIISEGQTLTLTLHNNLPAGAGNLSLELPAVQVHPDLTGAAPSGTASYAFGPLAAGTYIYEAGATIEQPRQLAMGLAGLIIVRPADFNAATPADFAGGLGGFDDEGLIVFNELDPAFNTDPLGSDVEDFTPHYFFINGKAHPATDEIGANAGQTVLLRAANLGIRDRALGLVNGRLSMIADDSHQVVQDHIANIESKLLTAGQVTDLTTLVEPSAHAGDQIPVLDLARHINNSDQGGVGGMLTFIDVVSPVAVPGGPVAKITGLTPAVNDGSADEVVDYTLSSGTANWYIDDIGGPCGGLAGGSPLTLTMGTLSGGACGTYWSTGDHVVWIVPNTPGSPAGDVYTLALQGPSVSALTVDPQFANLTFNKTDANPPGSTDVRLEGTAQPSMLDRTITLAEGCWTQPALDTPCPAPVAMTISPAEAPSHAQALHAVIPVASIPVDNATNTLYVRVEESDGSTTRSSLWADPNASVGIVNDSDGPSVTGITATPNPAGIGNYPGNLNFLESVRIQADISDLLSPIADAELFISTVDTDGSGSKMRPLAGQWLDDLTVHGRTAYLEVPIAELQSHDQGPITIYVHGKDAAGNWGPTTSIQLMLDKTNPVIVGTPTASSTPCGTTFCNRYQAQDETGAWVLTAGSIEVQAQDPPGGPTPVSQLPIPTGEVQIRYHVSSVQGTIGQAGAGIFYQTAQSALGTVVANNAGTYTIDFDWHLVFPTPGPTALPPEASTSVWVWVLDEAGNPSVPVEVPVGPPTNPTQVP